MMVEDFPWGSGVWAAVSVPSFGECRGRYGSGTVFIVPSETTEEPTKTQRSAGGEEAWDTAFSLLPLLSLAHNYHSI